MTSKFLVASFFAIAAATAVSAQDKIHLLNGTVVDNVRVTDYDIRALHYKKGGNSESVGSDQVAKVELGKYKTVYARGNNAPGLMLTLAKEQARAKSKVMAQLGFIDASAQFFDSGQPAEAISALNDLAKAFPEGGVLPEVYRQKFEYYMGVGDKGVPQALKVAKKYETDAIGGAWPGGFAVEAKFFQVLSEGAGPADFQNKLRSVISSARSSNPVVANRANIELAHSLRLSDKPDDAKKIYETISKKDGVDASSRAGAYLGLGHLKLSSASDANKDAYKEALLMFLRVRLETRDAWPSLHAEALYQASVAAAQWRGPEYRYIVGRCRRVLVAEFGNTEWADRVR